ncbi:MAG TPA: hypothetical protein VK524_07595, partial [Polyangiaceae bacterium]|nr:hypothetical protein [Polyangiaceae bacterium]
LGADTARASAAGADDSQLIALEAGAAGDRISGMVRVPEQDCVLLIARAAESVDDLDLFAYGDDGSVLGADEGTDKTPTLLVCPPHPARLFVSARVLGGHGLVAIGAQRVAPADAVRVGRVLSARGHAGEASARLAGWPALDEALAERRRSIGSRWQDLGRLAAPLDPRLPTRVSAVVDANRCLDVLVIPSQEASHVDVSVLDMRGRIVARSTSMGRERTVLLCAPTRTPITLEIRPHQGRGVAAVLLSRSAEDSSRELGRRANVFELGALGDLDESRAKNQLRLEQAGYSRAKVLSQGALEVGRRTSVPVDLPPGCSRLDVLSGAPVRGVEAWLWAGDGSLVASDRGSMQATLFACTAGGKMRLDAGAMMRPGRYALELRKENRAPKLFEQAPLAAGRLLASMTARGAIQNAGELSAELVQLSSIRLDSVPLNLAPGRCADVTVALGPGARGVEARLLDTASGSEVDFARGTYSASVKGCAPERAPFKLRLEMRAAAGDAAALVATRIREPKN